MSPATAAAPAAPTAAPAAPTAAPAGPGPAGVRTAVLLAALAGALLVRLGLAGVRGPHDAVAGAAFGALLLVIAVVAGRAPGPHAGPARAAAAALAGTGVLLAPPLVAHLGRPGQLPGAGFAGWAPVVVLVAVAEEAVLRGALFDAARAWRGERAALMLTTAAFALVHVPLYGAAALPLDAAAGIVLGGLRLWTGTVSAPAFAHAAADLAGWWLR